MEQRHVCWHVDAILTEIERQMPELFDAVTEIASVWDGAQRMMC